MNAYLIQRAEIKRPIQLDRFSNTAQLDYMGSAEFEFGALPSSLRSMQARKDALKLAVEKRIVDDQERSLRVLHFFEEAEYEEYVGKLLDLRAGRGYTKEVTHFEYRPATRRDPRWAPKTDLWWDITNHVMWSFDKQYIKHLPEILARSWQYMDEQAGTRNK